MNDDDDDLRLEDPALALALESVRDMNEEPPVGFGDRLTDHVRRALWWRYPVRRLAHDRRAQYAAASLGGVLVAAAAIAVLWRRTARRAVGTSGVPA